MTKLSVFNVLILLRSTAVLKPESINSYLRRDICLDMPLLRTRNYSVASIGRRSSAPDGLGTGQEVDIMVKVHPNGRFSNVFLNDSATSAALKYRIVDSISGPQVRRKHLAPFVIVATGAGFGPVRCLLQWRIAIARDSLAAGKCFQPRGSGISLFLGLKEPDLQLVVDVLKEAISVNLIDMLDIVLSNPEKRRVHDNLSLAAQHIKSKVIRRKGMVFVCASGAAAKGTKSMFESILGGSVGEVLSGRYIEEVF
jgi:sulfite reductase alpha subunit-like flavoprotein